MAGVWIGCDDRFVRLENNLGYGGQAARPIYEYFFQKALADKTLGLDRHAKFVQPENLKNEEFYDYPSIIEQTMPAGAEGENVGNGGADAYLSKEDTGNVPVESKVSMEEQKVLNEATGKQNNKKENPKDAVDSTKDDRKKKGFLRRIFGKKDRD
jgi:penicillin-binding protein 1A